MLIPPKFPRISTPARSVDGLAWYPLSDTYGLNKMQFEARDEIVSMLYPHPSDPQLYGVPRTLATIGPDTVDNRAVGERTFTAKFTSELREEQRPFLNNCYKMLELELGGIGEAPTGFGKTVCGAALITAIGRPTCIVIPKGDLDWTGEILEHTDIPEERIDTWHGKKLPDPEAWVVVASLQSIYRAGVYPIEIYRRFACVMFDEVHRLGAPEFSAACRMFHSRFRLGLSATADRRDGKMNLIHAHVGWRHVVGKSDAEQPDYYFVTSEWTEPFLKGERVPFEPTRTNMAKKSLMSDVVRNATIAGAAYRAHKKGRRTIIFVEQLAHMEALRSSLATMGIPKSMIVEYHGKTTVADRERAKACPAGMILIATYKYTAEGTNIPALDCAIIGHPIFDPRQAIGRITRKLEGKLKPIVLDVWDVKSGALLGMAKARWKALSKLGATWKGEFR